LAQVQASVIKCRTLPYHAVYAALEKSHAEFVVMDKAAENAKAKKADERGVARDQSFVAESAALKATVGKGLAKLEKQKSVYGETGNRQAALVEIQRVAEAALAETVAAETDVAEQEELKFTHHRSERTVKHLEFMRKTPSVRDKADVKQFMHQYSTDAVGQVEATKGSVIDVEPQSFAPAGEPRASPKLVPSVADPSSASVKPVELQSLPRAADPSSALEALATRRSTSKKRFDRGSLAPAADPFAALEDVATRSARSVSKKLAVGQSSASVGSQAAASPRAAGMLAQLPQIAFVGDGYEGSQVTRMVPARVREVGDVTILPNQDASRFLRGVRPAPMFGDMQAVFEQELQVSLSRPRCGAGAEAGVLLHALHGQDVHARGRVSIEAVCLARNVANHARSDATGSGSWKDSIAVPSVLERPRSTMKNIPVLPNQGANATRSRRLSRGSDAGAYESPNAFGKAQANLLASQSWRAKLPQSNKILFQ